MSETVAYPFLRPLAGTISAAAWRYRGYEGLMELGGVIPHWDYTTDIVVSRNLDVHADNLLEECALRDGAKFVISVGLTTGDVGIRRSLWKEELLISRGQGVLEREISIELPGQELQGHLDLMTSVSLVDGEPKNRLAPSFPGSRIWDDRLVCQLEGGGGRLPMEASDFTAVDPRLGKAPWMFHLETSDLDASFLGHFQVRLNSHRGDVIEAIHNSDTAILERLTNELVHHLISQVMDWDDYSGKSDDYEEESIGWTVSQWLDQAFPEEGLDEIMAMRKRAPAKFRAILSSTFGGHHGD
ncbi:hypothetical protein [Natronospira bacteriovora]|uniref:Urease accessory protein UreD n=1 Tax=Natronospira bacteriovora TaxID=3069753 RepID=A0ABU0W3P9_9GAMM|nr:hypothetical protein [Natronospira sp. AB-CW4]MDQ2068647.1 hypothetical protein [Natronospira sp. AB-CW4]